MQEWLLHFTYNHKGRSGFISLVTMAKDEKEAKKKAAECFMLTEAEVVFWESERLK